jgi:carbon monoxide dehydrogenase subunit G
VTVVRVEERFVVAAPVERVWEALVDPRRVVACVPGGELSAIVDERTFEGRVNMRLGPFALAYAGRVRLAEVDVAMRRVTIVGEAHEGSSDGAARLVLESRVTPLAGGGAEVVAHARIDVTGRVLELGRGLLEAMGHLVFRDFAARVRSGVEAEAREAGAGPSSAPPPARDALRPIPLVLRALGAWVAGWFRDTRPS